MRRSRTAALVVGLLALTSSAVSGDPRSRYYAADTEGIFWFMHVSDLHIDTSGAAGAAANLQFALGEAVQVLRPVFVFATGDLVNGTIMGIPTSGQDQGEWDDYKAIYTAADETPSFYFDLPGNHDGYGDHGMTHYIANSLQGRATNGALFVTTTHTTPLGDYYFVGMDSAGTYDTPFSFGDPSFTSVDKLAAGLAAHADAQLVFVFAHHHLVPHGDTDAQTQLGIGGPDNPPANVGDVMPLLEGAGAFYLHGHVHQYKESLQGNVVTEQIGKLGGAPAVDRSSPAAYSQTKYESNIGVGIVDHNAFVYRTTDTTAPWPFVAITAPVDVNLQGGGIPAGTDTGVDYPGDYLDYGAQQNPYAYDVCGPNQANPVRALVLSKSPIQSVNMTFDGVAAGPMTAAAEPQGIYTATLDTSAAEPGRHTLAVTAVSGGEARTDSIQINLTAGPCAPQADGGVADDGPAPSADGAAPSGDAPSGGPGGGSGSASGGCSVPHAAGPGGGGVWLAALALLLLRRRRPTR
jgi:MYXO-CTERM domain-containing protein